MLPAWHRTVLQQGDWTVLVRAEELRSRWRNPAFHAGVQPNRTAGDPAPPRLATMSRAVLSALRLRPLPGLGNVRTYAQGEPGPRRSRMSLLEGCRYARGA